MRQAMLYCLDWEGLMDETLGSQYVEDGYLRNMFGDLAESIVAQYQKDVPKANALLEAAEWTMNSTGSDGYAPISGEPRYKMTADSRMLGLNIRIAVTERMKDLVEKYWIENLKSIGVYAELVPMDMDDMISVYTGTASLKTMESIKDFDVVITGDGFFPAFIMEPRVEVDQSGEENNENNENTLVRINTETQELAYKALKTTPYDYEEYIRKLTNLQEYILEELPFVPLYTGDYMDFYVGSLVNYKGSDTICFSDAMAPSYITK